MCEAQMFVFDAVLDKNAVQIVSASEYVGALFTGTQFQIVINVYVDRLKS